MSLESKLNKKYGFFTAICTVVGIVIGSGIFFKASKVLNQTGGSMPKALLTVGIVGVIMLICASVFAILASRYEKVNGIVDYAESAVGNSYGFLMAWFMTVIYTPAITATLAWVTAQYTATLFGFAPFGMEAAAFAAFFLILSFSINTLSPKLGGKFQVATTIIKLIPIILMAVVGLIVGLANGNTVASLTETTQAVASQGGSIFGAIVAFAFAYEGWIIATTINSELKDSKKTLPRALFIGSIIVVLIYMAYFLGLTGSMLPADMIAAGGDLPELAFSGVFGSFAGSLIYVFIIISCYGTVNALMMGCIRNAYSIAARKAGLRHEVYSQVDTETNAPHNSAIIGLLICCLWLVYIYVCWTDTEILGVLKLPAYLSWEPDELPIITLYGGYIPIFVSMMIKERELSPLKRFVIPGLGALACLFMVFCAVYAYKLQALYYLVFFMIVISIGLCLYNRRIFFWTAGATMLLIALTAQVIETSAVTYIVSGVCALVAVVFMILALRCRKHGKSIQGV